MNNYSEAIEEFLAWLLQDSTPTVSTPSGKGSIRGTGVRESGTADMPFEEPDPLNSEETSVNLSALPEANRYSFQAKQSFEPGDQPAVQDRFHSLLKRRLQAEIERNPPLFPWESELCDYESDIAEPVSSGFWLSQLSHLNLPVPVPQPVLSQLFEQCQQVVHSSLREGAKLVQAVESLFPGHTTTLNQLAGLVITAPARSGAIAPQRPLVNPNFAGYEQATPPQQMVLSLLAAREILTSLTLEVSANQPTAERQWLTAPGTLTLTVNYLPQSKQLRVQCQLPASGTLRVQSGEAQNTAQRSTPGCLGVEVFDVAANQVYPVEIYLAGMNEPPIIFAIYPTETV